MVGFERCFVGGCVGRVTWAAREEPQSCLSCRGPALSPFALFVKVISQWYERSWNQSSQPMAPAYVNPSPQTSASPPEDTQQSVEQFWCPWEMLSAVISSWREREGSRGCLPSLLVPLGGLCPGLGTTLVAADTTYSLCRCLPAGTSRGKHSWSVWITGSSKSNATSD